MATARFMVSGRVQGVFYRASTREQALALRLSGSATNRPDGSVEVLASGPTSAIDSLERWLWRGPSAASVVAVSREDLPEQPLAGFRIG